MEWPTLKRFAVLAFGLATRRYDGRNVVSCHGGDSHDLPARGQTTDGSSVIGRLTGSRKKHPVRPAWPGGMQYSAIIAVAGSSLWQGSWQELPLLRTGLARPVLALSSRTVAHSLPNNAESSALY